MNSIDWHSSIAKKFDSRYNQSSAFKERFRLWTQLIDKFSNINGTVLDIGCGSGVFTSYAANKNARVIGFDGSGQMLELARRRINNEDLKNVQLLHATINEASNFRLPAFDLILSSSVLEYSDSIWQDMAFIASSLRHGGILLVSIPNRSSLYRKIEKSIYKLFRRPRYYRYVKNVMTSTELEEMLSSLGLQTLEIHYYGLMPWIGMPIRWLGLSRYADSLFVFACKKQSEPNHVELSKPAELIPLVNETSVKRIDRYMRRSIFHKRPCSVVPRIVRTANCSSGFDMRIAC